jgi:hypothetical protein
MQSMKENGINLQIKETEKVVKHGLMDHFMKDIGKMEKLMEWVD